MAGQPWIGREAQSLKSRIDNVIRIAEGLDDEQDELRSHLARYACVLISGLLETAVTHVIMQYSSAQSGPAVSRYVNSNLNGFQNPRMSKIVDLLSRFDPSWSNAIKIHTEGELKDSVDSIVANRHLVAHGKSTSLTIVRVKNYYRDCTVVIDAIDAVVNGRPLIARSSEGAVVPGV